MQSFATSFNSYSGNKIPIQSWATFILQINSDTQEQLKTRLPNFEQVSSRALSAMQSAHYFFIKLME